MDMSSRDINTIPTTRRHIVSYTIQVEWSDNPKPVILNHDMPNHVANAIDEWFGEIEHEENVDA
jgi:hypothetical protein